MKRIYLFFAAVMVAAVVGCVKEDGKGADLKVGDRLPDFEVVMNDGTVVTDDRLKGSVSMIVFFHTTCPDCQEVLPVIQRISDMYKPEWLKIAVISRDESENDIESYWREKGFRLPYSAQDDRSVYNKFAKNGIPRIYITNKGGIIRHVYTEDTVPAIDDLRSAIEFLMNAN